MIILTDHLVSPRHVITTSTRPSTCQTELTRHCNLRRCDEKRPARGQQATPLSVVTWTSLFPCDSRARPAWVERRGGALTGAVNRCGRRNVDKPSVISARKHSTRTESRQEHSGTEIPALHRASRCRNFFAEDTVQTLKFRRPPGERDGVN